MSKRVPALVKAALLIWARENAGFSVEQAARKISVKPGRLESWEQGAARPTVIQLRKLAQAYKRPLAVFYLPEPPKDFQALRDFRRFPGQVAGIESPELRWAIRFVQIRREVALELFDILELKVPEFAIQASLTDDPEETAHRIRSWLGISRQQQAEWRPGYDAFNGWRSALENAGLLVCQAQKVETSEMRGLSISSKPLPAIVVNTKDSLVGRIFSMLHELTHILLREGGVCDLGEESNRPPEEQQVEIFCNRVAGAVLVPRAELSRQVSKPRREWPDESIESLARQFCVSREVVLRRLLINGLATSSFYQKKRHEWLRELEERRQQKATGFAPPHRIAISASGPMFVRLVLQSYYQERITASDLSDYLGLRLKHLPKVESEVLGQASGGAVGLQH